MVDEQDHRRGQGDYGQEPHPRPYADNRFDRERDIARGHEGEFRSKDSRDFRDRGRDDRESRGYMQGDQESRDRNQRELRDRDQRDREQRSRDQRDREPRDRDQRDKEFREHRARIDRERVGDRERFKERDRQREREEHKENEKGVEEEKKGLSMDERRRFGFPDFKKGRISRKLILCSIMF